MEFANFKSLVFDHKGYIWPGSSDISEFDLEFSLNDSLAAIGNELRFIEKPQKIKFANLGFQTIYTLIIQHLCGEPLEKLQKIAKLGDDDIVLRLIVDILDENNSCMYFIQTLRENSIEELYNLCNDSITQIVTLVSQ